MLVIWHATVRIASVDRTGAMTADLLAGPELVWVMGMRSTRNTSNLCRNLEVRRLLWRVVVRKDALNPVLVKMAGTVIITEAATVDTMFRKKLALTVVL
jgi:hypothetical protein